VHLLTYVGIDQGADVGGLFRDIAKRPFIMVGVGAFLLMLPLAITSTDAMVREIGFKRWKLLHRLAYPVGVLAAIHFYMRVKSDVLEPLIYASVVAALLLIRLADNARSKKPKPKPTPG